MKPSPKTALHYVRAIFIAAGFIAAILFLTWLSAPGMEVPVALLFVLLFAGWGVVGIIRYGLIRLGLIGSRTR